MCHIFFIHLSVDGHLGCFYVLAIVNRAAIYIVVDTNRFTCRVNGQVNERTYLSVYAGYFLMLMF